eukprot:COSAG05_NODE_1597_length_4454_cov_228.028932_3_plen_74_part_00
MMEQRHTVAKCRSLVQADWDETVDKQWARDNKREVKLIKSSFDELGTDNTIATAQLDAVTMRRPLTHFPQSYS